MGNRIRLGCATTLAATVFVGLSGCGGQPVKPADTTNAAQATSVAATAPSGEAVTETAAARPTGKVPAGYRRVTRGGREYFCRSETTVGTKFAETFCFTRDQLKVIEERTDKVMDAIGRGCVGAGCGAE